MGTRTIVVGAGAIGGTVGAHLVRGGNDVLFVDRDADHVAAINQSGLVIDGPAGQFTVQAAACVPQDLREPIDTVLLSVKGHDTGAAAGLVAPLLHSGASVVCLQNGLGARIVARTCGAARTVPAFVNFSADLVEAGRIRYHGPGDFYLGAFAGAATARVAELAALLAPWGAVAVTDNIWGYLWSKLAYAAMLYATALADADQADVIDRYRPLMIDLASEVIDVARAESVHLLGFHGFEPDLYVPRSGRDWLRIEAATTDMLDYMRRVQKPRSGVWRDLAVRKRRTEVDHQVGLAVQIGAEQGLAMPLCRRLVELVHDIEEGRRPMSWDNLGLIEETRMRDWRSQ